MALVRPGGVIMAVMKPKNAPRGKAATDLAVLRVLAEERGLSLPDVAQAALIGESTARRAIRRLQSAGLATAPRLPGRSVPTESGRAWLGSVEAESALSARLRKLAGQVDSIREELSSLADQT